MRSIRGIRKISRRRTSRSDKEARLALIAIAVRAEFPRLRSGFRRAARTPRMRLNFTRAKPALVQDDKVYPLIMDYLLKTEPSEYSFADLQRDKTTIWDGVSNPVALKHLRGMKAGERLVIYETGERKSAVGTASVAEVDASDAKNPRVKIKVGKALARPVSLAEVKANKLFAESPLVRQGRLSVVPLTKEQYKFLTGE